MQVRDFDRPANYICYVVAGRLLFVSSDNSRLAELLAQVFAGWQVTPVPAQNEPPDVLISCYVGQETPFIPSDVVRFEIANQAQCYVLQDGLVVDFGDSFLRLHSNDSVSIEVWFKTEPSSVDANLATTLSFAVCVALRRHGIFELHSAGVLAPDEKSGVLILGPSGSGKSTLTTQLAASRWKYLSDDELLLSLEKGQVVARGFRSFFALSNQALAAAGFTVAGSSIGTKTLFEPVQLFGGHPVETAIPRVLFFTSISSKMETQVVELSRTETMTRLLRASPWATYDRDVAAENLKVLSELARQAVGFDLAAGRDLLTPGYAGSLLQRFIKS